MPRGQAPGPVRAGRSVRSNTARGVELSDSTVTVATPDRLARPCPGARPLDLAGFVPAADLLDMDPAAVGELDLQEPSS